MRKGLCVILCLLLTLFVYSQTIQPSGPLNICNGSSIALSVSNAPANATFQWRKDGTDILNATSDSYMVSASGSYSVVVSGTAIGPVVVTVRDYPKAGFTFSPNNQCSNTPVGFTNTSTGTGLTYVWSFGDPNSSSSNSSTAINPQHVFIGTPGNGTQNFAVKLVANNSGCKDSVTQTITTKQIPGVQLGGTGALIYNGLNYFTKCASTTSEFTFSNQSSTKTTNTAYLIKWGDGTTDFTTTTFDLVNHTYGIGNYHLQFIVSGTNGCTDTGEYYVFVGNNPAVGFNNPGNTFICSQTSLTFPITGTTNNPPGTTYTVSFNDFSSPVTFTHPAPASVTHFFDKGSCGTNTSSFPNSFQADIQASNPCGTSAASVVPIYVSEKSKATIGFSPDTIICVNNLLTATNLSGSGYGISGSGLNAVCTPGKGLWSISPATGWTLTSGSLGNDFGSNDPSLWLNGSTTLTIKFSLPGTYSVRLRTSASELCGGDEVTRIICVNPVPVADFTLSSNTGCAPFNVTTTNKSNSPLCGDNIYQWSMDYNNAADCTPNSQPAYSFTNGTNSSSPEPQFQFTNPGIYKITLVTKNSKGLCTSAAVAQTITVKTKPSAAITAPNAVCQNGTINPSATVNNCYATTAATYAWSFPGGVPATSTSSNPGAIHYSSPGTYTIKLEVSNECGTTTVTKSITVNPAPDVTVPANKTFCAGAQSGTIVFSSSVSTATFVWTNSNTAIGLPASGTGNIPSFVTNNNTNAPVTATITVTPTSGCSGVSQAFTITVNPRPEKPAVVRPVVYCLNETPSALSAIATSGNALTWYTTYPLSNGSSTAPVPSTAPANITTYYVTQSNGYSCESDTAKIVVTVNPKIANNAITPNQTICNGGSAQPLTTGGTVTGGSGVYNFQWQLSTDGGTTWTNLNGATGEVFNPGAITSSTSYRRIVSSSNCVDTSNIVNVLVLGSLTNSSISASQTICQGTQPDTLRGQIPVGGNGTFSYQWQISSNNISWTDIAGATGVNYLPAVLNATTYFRRKVSSGECSVISSPVQITVNRRPVMIAVSDKYYCSNATTTAVSFSSSPAASSYAWINNNPSIGLAADGTNSIPSFTTANNSNPSVPVAATIAVIPTFTNNNVSCAGDTVSFKIVVLPTVSIEPPHDTTLCTGQAVPAYVPQPNAGAVNGANVQYRWSVSGSGISLTSGFGTQVPGFSTSNAGSADLIATITITPTYSYAGITCDGVPSSYKIIVKPSTASANAGQDQTICAQTSATLTTGFVSGTTGVWSSVGTSANITNPTSNITTITGLVPGTVYKFVWTQTGFASCPSTTDTVIIDNKLPLNNKIDTAAVTICVGGAVNVSGFPASGGGDSYTYQWQQSSDGINFTNINGATLQNLAITPPTTVWLRRFVTATPCSGYSDTLKITVQPALTNNRINANSTICIGNPSPTISGSLPSGGNNSFTYEWEQSTNGGATWTTINGANAVDYSPGILSQTTQFRRMVSTTLCSGPFSSISNVVTVTVNPDARALFLPSDTVKCSPFSITPSVINLQTNTANGQYLWYANGVLIGQGTRFPGYTISNENDSVFIKLKAVSAFGCKDDSLVQKFVTPKRPSPSFILSDTVGCGPLTVQATNTSTYINEFTYFWDFGNGRTSTATQPSAITFEPNPDSGDTIYVVKLKVFSACDTLTFSRFVRVKSAPQALFTPVKTTGCSPMKATFRNTSRGYNNTYYWDFGDGSTLATTSPDSVQHIFNAGRVDTFYVKLKVVNECGSDSIRYAIVVSPNTIRLNVAVNGPEHFGCAPHAVAFINNTRGASTFLWNFGDGNILSTTKNIDTVYHTYQQDGKYTVQLRAFNNCSDTSTTEIITVYAKPKAAFTANNNAVCIGDTVRFTNLSDSATSYLWQFGDGNTSTLVQPTHQYKDAGLYTVKLIIFRNNPSGSVCTDSISQQVQVASTLPGTFSASDTVSQCAPLSVTFVNRTKPSVTAAWDFGDGTTGTGDSVVHTYAAFGTYPVKLTVTVPGGCTYISSKTVNVFGPGGTLTYTGGYNCSLNAVHLQVDAKNTDSFIWDFGDGKTITTTAPEVYHSYANPGSYLPSVKLVSNNGCTFPLKGIDTIKVDKIAAGFATSQQVLCGSTTVSFTDTSRAFFGKASVKWSFGDGSFGTGFSATHIYTASGTYPVQMIVLGNSGCSDTVRQELTVQVNSKPTVSINNINTGCTGKPISFTSTVQSADAINIRKWTLSNGATVSTPTFTYQFLQPGTYTLQFTAGTVNGCYDTTSTTLTINPGPELTVSASTALCLGSSVPLSASGAETYQWMPLRGLNCYTCANPVASPTITTPYVVEGKNSFGCVDYDTVVVTVIQPLKMVVSGNDSICIGQSTNLLVRGGTNYNWSPAQGLNNTTISNPTASPTVTTTYRVVGYDGFNCFTDTAFVTVAVGQYPIVELGPDLTLAAGTQHQLISTITNGPIRDWVWTPATDLSCNNCAVPTADIKKDITYAVKVTTPYGCSASDTVSIKVFCESSQVFIPNAFTPDGDGINDILMVRSKGVVTVRFFRIFNRWGNLVFEKSNFQPNNPLYAWDGKINGVVGGPDVYVYTCEVLCENGTSFTYKGNVSIIK
jgi:gliding motility-associated-like protein